MAKSFPKQNKPIATKTAAPIKKTSPETTPYIKQKQDYLFPSIIALFAFFLCANTFQHGYVLDDSAAITENQFVQKGFAGISDILKVDLWHFANHSYGYFRPFSLITFAIEHQFFGSNPHVSHFFNVLYYALTGFVLCLLLQTLFTKYNKVIPFFICLLFIAHPAHTEVVANLKSRDEIFSFLGIISTLYIMLRWDGDSKKTYIIMAMIICYLGLLSKETAITTLLLLPACFYFFREKTIMQSIVKVLPILAMVFLFYIHKNAVLGPVSDASFEEINNYPYAESKFLSSMSIFAYCLKILIAPYLLRYDYSYNLIPAGSFSNPITLIGLLLFFGLLYLTIKEIMKKSIWGFALSVFFVTFLPAMGFVWLRGGIMAERFLYASSLGFCIAVIFLFAHLFKLKLEKVEEDSTASSANSSLKFLLADKRILLLVVVIFGLYSFKTIDRNKAWKSNFVLFSTDISSGYNSAQNNRHYGNELLERAIAEKKDTVQKMKDFNESMKLLHRAVEINPRFGEVWGDLGRAYTDVKLIPDSCIYFYKKSIQCTPGAYRSYNNMGIVYEAMQRYELASYFFNTAFMINPTFTEGQKNADRIRTQFGIDVRIYPGGEDPKFAEFQVNPVLK